MLVGYVLKPQGPHSSRMPAVVMMHGRAGAYSSLAGADMTPRHCRRHQQWGRLWAQQGYWPTVDGFGPRGYPQGFGRFHPRPNVPKPSTQVTVRPLDAYGALAYLRTRRDVIANRIALQGWSMVRAPRLPPWRRHRRPGRPGLPTPDFTPHWHSIPGCGLMGQFKDGVLPYAPVQVVYGHGDEEGVPRPAPNSWRKADPKCRHRNHVDIRMQRMISTTQEPAAERSCQRRARQDAMQRAVEFLKHAISHRAGL